MAANDICQEGYPALISHLILCFMNIRNTLCPQVKCFEQEQKHLKLGASDQGEPGDDQGLSTLAWHSAAPAMPIT